MAASEFTESTPREGLARRLLLALFGHRTLYLLRWDLHFMGLRVGTALSGQRRRVSQLLAARPRPLFLNLGSGPRGLVDPHWINVEGFPDKHVDVLIDFTRGLPFPAATFAGVFTEHVIEHFTLEDGEKVSREVLRVLEPGGVYRIIVPDAEKVLRWYFSGELAGHRDGRTPMEAVNSYFRQRYDHQFMYDGETMSQMLLRVGFSRVEVGAFGKGSALAKIDDPAYASESLYVDAYA